MLQCLQEQLSTFPFTMGTHQVRFMPGRPIFQLPAAAAAAAAAAHHTEVRAALLKLGALHQLALFTILILLQVRLHAILKMELEILPA